MHSTWGCAPRICSISHIKLTWKWVLVKANFDLIQKRCMRVRCVFVRPWYMLCKFINFFLHLTRYTYAQMRPRAETRWDHRDSVACWCAALFLSRSACLLRTLTLSLERFLCLRILTLLRSLRCSSTSIIHQAGEGTTRLRLRQLSTCLPPGVAPRAESVTDIIYIR